MAREQAGVVCFGAEVHLGDARLDRRVISTMNQMGVRPGGTLPVKLPFRRDLLGNYRLVNHEKVTHKKLIEAHRRQVIATLGAFSGKLLLVHDTTVLDYSGLSVADLGQVGDGHGRGLYAHQSLLVDPATGHVLGLLNQILHRRDQVPPGETKRQRRQRPNRESRLWKQAVMDVADVPAHLNITDVSDRGSDITEYMAYALAHGRTFIVRSQHNRVLLEAPESPADPAAEEALEEARSAQLRGKRRPRRAVRPRRAALKLHEHMAAQKAMAHRQLTLRDPQGGVRTVDVEITWCPVQIKAPRHRRGDHDLQPLHLHAVMVREVGLPEAADASLAAGSASGDGSAVAWILLTNRPVTTLEQAQEVVSDYARRWVIEDFQKCQKTGCGIEALQLTTLHGLSNAIAMISVLAVWVHQLKTLARDPATAEEPATARIDPLYVHLAAAETQQEGKPLTLGQFYVAVARMGGYQHNPRKKPPGWLTLWRGYVRLHDMAKGARHTGGRCVQS